MGGGLAQQTLKERMFKGVVFGQLSCRLPMARSEVIRSPAAVGSDPPPPMGFLTFLLFCWRQSGTKLGLECGRREYQSVSETFFDEKQPERSTTTALENNPKNTTHSGGDLEFSLQHGVYGVPLTHPLNMPVRVPLPPPSSPSCTALPPPSLPCRIPQRGRRGGDAGGLPGAAAAGAPPPRLLHRRPGPWTHFAPVG